MNRNRENESRFGARRLFGHVCHSATAWIAAIALVSGAAAHADPVPMSVGDRIVAEEMPTVESVFKSGGAAALRARYLEQQKSSPAPQAYDFLIGLLAPQGSPEARERLSRACDADETFALARAGYYRIMKSSDPERAATYAKQGWSLQPLLIETARAYADLCLERGDLDGAEGVARTLMAPELSARHQGTARFILAQAAWRRQKWEDALLHFQAAAQVMTDDEDAMSAFAAYIATRGAAPETGKLIERLKANPHGQALIASAVAETLNRSALRELKPTAEAPDGDAIARRAELVKQYDASRAIVPYGVAWDAERLAIRLDAENGQYLSAWERFLTRVPPELTISALAPTAERFINLRDAINQEKANPALAPMRDLREAMAAAGWTAESLKAGRDILLLADSTTEDQRAAQQIATHLDYLRALAVVMEGGRLRELPLPPVDFPIIPRRSQRHPDSSSVTSGDPTVLYLRQKNLFLNWMAEPWETRSARLMAIFFESPRFPLQSPQAVGAADVVVGEDLISPAGAAANCFAQHDTKLNNVAMVSTRFEPLLLDLFVRQADRGARSRIDGYFAGEMPAGWEVDIDIKSFSPDALSALAQVIFEDKGVGAAAVSRDTLPGADETYKLRNETIEALVDHLARREACYIGLQPEFTLSRARREAHADYFALSTERWPRMGIYYMYWAALNGDASQRQALEELTRTARDRGFLQKGRQPLLQIHFLSDMQIKTLARDLLDARSWSE